VTEFRTEIQPPDERFEVARREMVDAVAKAEVIFMTAGFEDGSMDCFFYNKGCSSLAQVAAWLEHGTYQHVASVKEFTPEEAGGNYRASE
jgi:hypothetical protein